ncbi:hypothetical protein FKM82_010011 [Ascaphus truei]
MEKSKRKFSFTPVRAAKIPANISPQRGRSLPLTEGCRKKALKLKDLPREKPFLQECVQQLHEFLAENRYAEYRPMLQAPSTGDSHLLSLIDTLLRPGFGMPSTRLQDEICGIFTGLGFPFALLKSSFYAVEAISRPQFDTMVWLIGVLKIYFARQNTLNREDHVYCRANTANADVQMFLNIQKDCGHILSGKNDMQQYGRELEMLLVESLYNGNPASPPAARAGHRAFSRKMADVQWDQAQELVEVQLTEHHKLTRRPGPAPFSAERAARQNFQIRRNLHGAQTCMIQCQAQIDALGHQVNQQIDQMEIESFHPHQENGFWSTRWKR